MQTFLPYRDFSTSAQCLDNKRLGKQRVEVLQILKALHDPKYGWQNHPAVKMWRHNEQHLVLYGLAICEEWVKRGFKDSCYDKINAFYTGTISPSATYFWRNEKLSASHRSNLLRKDYIHYSRFGWQEPNDLPYIWPI